MNNPEKGILAFLAGLATGAILGILFAPRSGDETRKMIGEKVDEYSEDAKKKMDEMVKSGKDELLKAKKKAVSAVEKATENLRETEEKLTDEVKGKVKDAAEKVK